MTRYITQFHNTVRMLHVQSDKLVSFLVPPIPPGVDSEYHAWYRAQIIGSYLLIVSHVVIVLGWWYAGVLEMVYYHLVSFGLLVACAVFVRRGRLFGGLIFGTVEILLHSVLGTYYAGWESGLHIPIVGLAIAWSAHPGHGNTRRRFVGLGLIAFYVVFLMVARTRPPVYTLPDWYLTVSSAIMNSFIAIPLLALVVLQAVSAGWYMSLQKEREKSEHLLLNVLPAKIATRLKESDAVIADRSVWNGEDQDNRRRVHGGCRRAGSEP